MTNATRFLFLILVFTILVSPAPRVFGQGDMQAPPGPQQREQRDDPFSAEQKREMAKQQNLLRHQELKKDTDKLLELATELKQYVDKSNENVLSMDVVKKAEQIEKLAKSVKDKMKAQ
jgi:hypothetical protein